MNTIFYRSSKVFGLTCFLFLFINPLFGQLTQLFSGERNFGISQGHANYEYVVEGIDTIFNGSFQFQKSNLEALLKDNDSTFFVSGSFDFGVPQGDWKFQFGSYQSDSLAQVTGFQYQLYAVLLKPVVYRIESTFFKSKCDHPVDMQPDWTPPISLRFVVW